jgi:hypothetical protein
MLENMKYLDCISVVFWLVPNYLLYFLFYLFITNKQFLYGDGNLAFCIIIFAATEITPRSVPVRPDSTALDG